MKIPHYRELKQRTDAALSRARDPKKAIVAYAAIISVLGLVVSALTLFLDHKISATGGLANMGLRSVLSTVQSLLPMVQSVLLMCLELGYISAAMRFARMQYADHTDLRTGFRLFAPLLRLSLLQLAIYFGILLAAYYLGLQLYLLTPFAEPLLELLIPLTEAGAVLDDRTMFTLLEAMLPVFAVVFVLFALLSIPVSYRYRMANYRLVDKPREGAFAALRNSRHMMRGNCFALFKVDLHFWWYHLLTLLATLICYGDQLLPLVGIRLPMSDTVAFFLFYVLYLVLQFLIFYFFRNRLEVTCVTAYDAIRPQEEEDSVILGNIFDLQ